MFASSVALHVMGFALAGWATHGKFRVLMAAPGEHVSRAHAVHYLILTHAATRPESRPEPRPPSPPEQVAAVRATAILPASASTMDTASQHVPHRSAVQTEELAPGAISGIGKIIPTSGSDSTMRGGLGGMLGLQAPPTVIEPARRGLERVAELVGVAGSACPELLPSAAGSRRQFAVAVAFVVNTAGAVDRSTLRIVESPDRPQTHHQFHSRIYVVGATVRASAAGVHPAAYDSVVTAKVASHVAGLVFRPALRDGRPVRSTVLVACQTS